MTNLIDRWTELTHNKLNEFGATATSGTMVVDGFDDSWTLADWSTALGMFYIITMLIPRIFEFGKWLMKKWEKYRGERQTKS